MECKSPSRFHLEKEWLRTTYCFGFSHVANEKHPRWLRVLWVVSIMACAATMSFQLYRVLDGFLAFPSATDITIELEEALPFPAVTLCSLSRFVADPVDEWLKGFNESSFWKRTIKSILWEATNIYQPYPWVTRNTLDNLRFLSTTSRDILGNTTLDSLYAMAGQEMDQSVCFWLGNRYDDQSVACDPADLLFSTSLLGNCVTFNSNGTRWASLQGTYAGLVLTTEENRAMAPVEPTLQYSPEGSVLLIHPPYVSPSWVVSTHMFLAPDSHNSVSLEMIQREMTGPPHGSCSSDQKLESSAVYSLEMCQLECRSRWVLKNCSCAMVGLPAPERVRKCTLVDHLSCANLAFLRSYDSKFMEGCECPYPCSTLEYKPQLSSSRVPPNRRGRGEILLDVHFDSKSRTIIRQQATTNLEQLLGSVGGQCAFFMGMSVMTLVEVVIYIARKLVSLAGRVNTAQSVQSGVDVPAVY